MLILFNVRGLEIISQVYVNILYPLVILLTKKCVTNSKELASNLWNNDNLCIKIQYVNWLQTEVCN